MKYLKKFGESIKDLRIKKELSLRAICQLVNYDASNWSKIERGIISPSSDEKVLKGWARALGLSSGDEIQKFIDEAKIAQGIIPQDIMTQKDIVAHLPAFLRTLRNKKPTKEELDKLIELIKGA